MREKERMERVLELIRRIWLKQPDSRFLQMISNILWRYSTSNNDCLTQWSYSKWESEQGVHFNKDISNVDGFHVEDDKLEEFLKQYIEIMPVHKEKSVSTTKHVDKSKLIAKIEQRENSLQNRSDRGFSGGFDSGDIGRLKELQWLKGAVGRGEFDLEADKE